MQYVEKKYWSRKGKVVSNNNTAKKWFLTFAKNQYFYFGKIYTQYKLAASKAWFNLSIDWIVIFFTVFLIFLFDQVDRRFCYFIFN